MNATNFGDDAFFANEDFQVRDVALVRAIVQEMLAERSILTVMLPGSGESYNSAVLEVDAKQGVLTLDELVPGHVNGQGLVGIRIRALGRAKGIATAFDAEILACGQDRQGMVYKAAMPRSVYQLQRREHFRVPPSVHEPIKVRLRLASRLSAEGELFDISLGGLGLFLGAESIGQVQRGDRIPLCAFFLPQEGGIEVELEVRSLTPIRSRSGRHAVRLGAQFVALSPAMRAVILRYVTKRDREILRQVKMGQ